MEKRSDKEPPMLRRSAATILGCILTLFCQLGFAKSLVIQMNLVAPTGSGESIGTVTAEDTPYGLLLTPNLKKLPPGIHGFHIHANPTCADSGKAAGGHLDPKHTEAHLGPYNPKGHLGDLPVLIVDQSGHATLPVLAPRLKIADIEGRSLMIHAGGDNYSDQPLKLGGGGDRIACGVIQ